MRKYEEIARMLRRRIEKEDYGYQSIPGARRLAEETGVSYLTALKALKYMVDAGWAMRAGNGRLAVNERQAGGASPSLRVAFLSPVREHDYFLWENAVQKAAISLGCSYRMIFFTHSEDPVITEVISGSYDVVFLSHLLPENSYVRELVRRNRERIVTLFIDMTEEGVRCLDGPSPDDTAKLVEHLYGMGHRTFASVMVSPETRSSNDKLAQWDASVRAHGCVNHEVRRPLKPFELTLIPAYELTLELLQSGELTQTAIFAPTLEIAISMIRAMHERGLAAGKDVSVCSFGQPERARMHIPSITVINRPDPTLQAQEVLRQYLAGKADRLMFRPGEGALIDGESTGPAPRQPKRKRA